MKPENEREVHSMENYRFNVIAVLAMNALSQLLKNAGVPHTCNPCYDGLQICFPWHDGDVAAHSGTFGVADAMVESFEFPWDDGDVTMAEPEDMAQRIILLYYSDIRS